MPEALIHTTAVVDSGARLGTSTEIGPYAVVEAGVVIGARCRIGAHAVIKRFTSMGEDNQIFEGAVLGGVPQDLKFSGAISYLTIGSANIFREGVTVHRATTPGGETRIGNYNYLMVNAHVAHDCLLGNHVILANNVGLAGHITIEDHAFLSGGVMIHQFSRIGKHSMVGGHAKVTQDVLPFVLVDGIPAKVRSLNLVGLRRAGFAPDEIRNLKQASRILFCPGQSLETKLATMAEIDSDAVRHLVRFIHESKRGFCRMSPDTDEQSGFE
ncbi:MAG TPA: acyl-ACP--UDP-N-acetylglucosamine O-acyltransferase [Acidobacteriota bacterium]|jgi:UDP-N-acetylglucosamine acyltransferase